MNPFSSPAVKKITRLFYEKFYDDTNPRTLILGINPGRHGAGATGIPFTDTKRLNSECGIPFNEFQTHETSSVFVYDIVNAYGGPEAFYRKYYITSASPLGFVVKNERGREVNYNYYDDPKLERSATPFIIDSIRKQLAFGINRNICYCLGKKNTEHLEEINRKQGFFKKLVPLEHPRFIMQYRLKKKDEFVKKYLNLLNEG